MQYYSIAEFGTSPSALSSALWQRIMTYSFVRVNFSSLRSFIDSHNTPASSFSTTTRLCFVKTEIRDGTIFQIRCSTFMGSLFDIIKTMTGFHFFSSAFFFLSFFFLKKKCDWSFNEGLYVDWMQTQYFSMIKKICFLQKMRLQKQDCFV